MPTLLRLCLPVLVAVALAATPTIAQEEPVEEPADGEEEVVYEDITFYLHGTETVGELEATGLGHMSMDTQEPTESDAKSRGITNYVRGPNQQCSGNWLLPTWDGWISGTVEGDVTVVLHTLTHPGASFVVDLFADGGGACNEDYVEPVASQIVEFAAGEAETEVVFEDVSFDVWGALTIMLRAPDNPIAGQPTTDPYQGRVYYDSVDRPSRIELQCRLEEDKETCL